MIGKFLQKYIHKSSNLYLPTILFHHRAVDKSTTNQSTTDQPPLSVVVLVERTPIASQRCHSLRMDRTWSKMLLAMSGFNCPKYKYRIYIYIYNYIYIYVCTYLHSTTQYLLLGK